MGQYGVGRRVLQWIIKKEARPGNGSLPGSGKQVFLTARINGNDDYENRHWL